MKVKSRFAAVLPRNAASPTVALFLGLHCVFYTGLSESQAGAVVRVETGLGADFIQPPPFAATFRFEIVDLADATPGQDLWEYRYTVSDLALTAGQGFTIFFDFNLYTLLQNPPPLVNADWDPITVQPDLALHSNGFYDAQARRNAPSLADPFKVRFVWLGSAGTTPGGQPFTVYDTDFTPIAQGQTVPEPAASALLLAAASLLAQRRTRSGDF